MSTGSRSAAVPPADGRQQSRPGGAATASGAGSGAGRVRLWMRLGLAALAVEMLLLGVPAAAGPRWFTDWFPLGRGWVAATGPYNEHSVADLGYAFLGLGAVLVWAAARLGRDVCRLAGLGATVANVPHLIFHLSHPVELAVGDNLAQDGLLGVSVAVSLAVLGFALYRPDAVG